MATIKHEIIGDGNFLRSPEYCFYIPGLLGEFENQFHLAEYITIKFQESINPDPNRPDVHNVELIDGGKSIKIDYKTARHFKPNNTLSKPTVEAFFRGLRTYMEAVIADDEGRFLEQQN